MSELINLTSGSILTTAVLICDPVVATNGSPDAIPSRTLVGTQSVDAALELQSTQGGLLIPRLTTTQMNNLVTVNGMIIYNTTANQFYGYQNGSWSQLGASSGGTVTSISQGTNMSFSVNPITTTGTINLASTLTGLTSVGVGSLTLSTTAINSSGALTLGTNGSTTALTLNTSQNASFAGTVTSGNITLSTSNVNSSGSLILGTNGSTTALTLDTSQNATFGGNININNSGTLYLGANATGATTFNPVLRLFKSTSLYLDINCNTGGQNNCQINAVGSQLSLSSGNNQSINLAPSSCVLLGQGFYLLQSSQNTYISVTNTGTWSGPALNTNGAILQVAAINFQDNSTPNSGTNAGPACVWGFNTPTLSASHTSVTTTTACTVYIGGAPVAGTNNTITNAYSFYVNGGTSHFGGVIDFSGGTSATATAGAGSLPAAPVGFINVLVGGTAYRVPYYNT